MLEQTYFLRPGVKTFAMILLVLPIHLNVLEQQRALAGTPADVSFLEKVEENLKQIDSDPSDGVGDERQPDYGTTARVQSDLCRPVAGRLGAGQRVRQYVVRRNLRLIVIRHCLHRFRIDPRDGKARLPARVRQRHNRCLFDECRDDGTHHSFPQTRFMATVGFDGAGGLGNLIE